MPPQFSNGLNMPSKKLGAKPGIPLGQKRKKNIFDDESDDEDKKNDNGAVEVSTLGGLDAPQSASKSSKTAGPPPKRKMQLGTGKPSVKPLNRSSIFADDEDEDEEKEKARQGKVQFGFNTSKNTGPNPKDFTNLSALHSSRKHAKEAKELDPAIYSYDAVYDSLHAKPEKSATTSKSEVPQYMENLLRSAEIRKRDQLRARDRQLAKEREAEGEDFADKETFVTGAYKAQQAEMQKLEEDEARREKEEEERRKQNGGSGMVDFYRDMLSRSEAKHDQVVKATEEAAKRVKEGVATEEPTAESDEKSEAQKAADLNARGAHIVVNDEGQVVDKRQLLSAGLNVAPKPKTAPAAKPVSRGPIGRPAAAGNQSGRGAQRARQTEMISQQLEERARQEEEAEAAKEKELAEKNRSRKTTGDVSSAKERYLARKREREEAAAKAKAT